MTGASETTKYFSIESSPKPRRSKSYFWTIFLSIAVVAASLHFGVRFSQQQSQNGSKPVAVADPSTGLVKDDSVLQQPKEITKQSYQVNMDKTEWPELIGVDGEVAKQTVQGENPSITKVQILPKDSFVTMDYSTSRVRIFVNDDNTVARAPRVG